MDLEQWQKTFKISIGEEHINASANRKYRNGKSENKALRELTVKRE